MSKVVARLSSKAFSIQDESCTGSKPIKIEFTSNKANVNLHQQITDVFQI
jgi:hypothetical protein